MECLSFFILAFLEVVWHLSFVLVDHRSHREKVSVSVLDREIHDGSGRVRRRIGRILVRCCEYLVGVRQTRFLNCSFYLAKWNSVRLHSIFVRGVFYHEILHLERTVTVKYLESMSGVGYG